MTMIMSIMTVMTCKAVIRNLFRVGGGFSRPFRSFPFSLFSSLSSQSSLFSRLKWLLKFS